jgi:large subunit ribosomal protein L29
MKKVEDLKGKSVDELKKTLLEKRKEQFNMRFQKTGQQLENTSQLRKIRRDIARIKTFINQQSKKTA